MRHVGKDRGARRPTDTVDLPDPSLSVLAGDPCTARVRSAASYLHALSDINRLCYIARGSNQLQLKPGEKVDASKRY